MIDVFRNLGVGFGEALSLANLFYCFMGALLGTLVGVLPGIGPLTTIAILLPLTFSLPPTGALIMLAGIYYGAQYGGSTTAVLVNLPGETSSVVTCLDGHQMALQGRAGPALFIAAFGSLFAGIVGTLAIATLAPSMTALALQFGPADYFSLMVLGLVAAAVLAHGPLLKAVAMILIGLLLGVVGTDVTSGMARFTFGVRELGDGVDFVVLAMALFGVADVIANTERKEERRILPTTAGLAHLLPTRSDLRASWRPVLRGTALGSVLGLLPGGGATLAAFSSYALEKRVASSPERFGKGAIEGVAGPESANNAAAQTSFIPMLTLGIPSNPVMALMIGAMMIQGIVPGPQVISERPILFWGLVASMLIGNLFLVILNLPLIGIWIRLLTVPYSFLYPAILLFCCIGAFSTASSLFNIWMLAGFGIVGYLLIKLRCEPAPLLLGFILGPNLEEHMRRAMLLSRGDASVFLQEPISLALLVCAAVLLALTILPSLRRYRKEAFE